MTRTTALVLTLFLSAAVACDRSAETETTLDATAAPGATVTTGAPATTAPEPGTTVGTVVTIPAVPVEDYQIAVTTSAEQGQLMWVVIPAADYRERDLENFLLEVVEENESLWEFHVFDDMAAVEAARKDRAERSEAEQRLVNRHYLLSLTEGNLVTFRGPYADSGSFILGS